MKSNDNPARAADTLTIDDKAACIADCFNNDKSRLRSAKSKLTVEGWRGYRNAIEGRTVARIIEVTLAVLERLDHDGRGADYIEQVSSAGFRAVAARKRRDDAYKASKASKKGTRHEN